MPVKPQHILAASVDAFRAEPTKLPGGEHLYICQREMLEKNLSYRQIIPYATVQHDGKLLAYRRTTKAGEARLHGKVSVGFGGHIDLVDVVHTNSVIDLEATIAGCCARELAEELVFEGSQPPAKFSGALILLDDTPTDAVHVGAVFVIEAENSNVRSAEEEIEVIGWFTPDEILAIDNLENWTRVLAEQLSAERVSAPAALGM